MSCARCNNSDCKTCKRSDVTVSPTSDWYEAPSAPDHYTMDVEVSPTAAKMVELDFNPDGREDVRRLKVLGAGLITLAETIRDTSNPNRQGPRRASTGITDIEKGVMMIVKALFA